jgi:hypothetical protein
LVNLQSSKPTEASTSHFLQQKSSTINTLLAATKSKEEYFLDNLAESVSNSSQESNDPFANRDADAEVPGPIKSPIHQKRNNSLTIDTKRLDF